MAKNADEPEQPRSEPEIIPPGRSGGPNDRGPAWQPPYYGFTETRGTHRIYVRKIGPFGFAILMLALGLFAAVFLLVLVGAALIWIPLVAVLVIAAVISRLFRR
jgi:hypothetical protein